MVSWISFLLADEYFKRKFGLKGPNGELKENHETLKVLGVSFGVGIVNTWTNMPLDTIKTQIQMNSTGTAPGILKTARSVVKQNGIAGLYTGWR